MTQHPQLKEVCTARCSCAGDTLGDRAAFVLMPYSYFGRTEWLFCVLCGRAEHGVVEIMVPPEVLAAFRVGYVQAVQAIAATALSDTPLAAPATSYWAGLLHRCRVCYRDADLPISQGPSKP